MPVQWYVVRGDVKLGPFSSRQLKRLADEGKLLPQNLILKGDARNPHPASQVGGLFDQSPEAPGQQDQVPEIVTDTSSTGSVIHKDVPNNPARLAIIGLILVALVAVSVWVVQLNFKSSSIAGTSDSDQDLAAAEHSETKTQNQSEFALFKKMVESEALRMQDQATSVPKDIDQQQLDEGIDGVKDGILRAMVIHRSLTNHLLFAVSAETEDPGKGQDISDKMSDLLLNQKETVRKSIHEGNSRDFQGRLAMQVTFVFLFSQEMSYEQQIQDQLLLKGPAKARFLSIYRRFKRDWVAKARHQLEWMIAENNGRLQMTTAGDVFEFDSVSGKPEASTETIGKPQPETAANTSSPEAAQSEPEPSLPRISFRPDDAAKDAKVAYEADLNAAREKYAAALDEAAKAAVEAGDLDKVLSIKAAKEELSGDRVADALKLAHVQHALEGTKWTWTSAISGKNSSGLTLMEDRKINLSGVQIGAWQMVEPRTLYMRVDGKGVWFLFFNEDYTEYTKILNFLHNPKHNIKPGKRTDPPRSSPLRVEAKTVSSQEDFGKWATSRFDPLFQKTELRIFRENSPKAELITAQIDFNYEQWKYVSVFEDLTGTFIDGHMVGLAFTYKYPADPEQASVNLAKIKAELGAPSTDSKRGPGLEDAISAFRWFDKPRKGYSTLCVLKSLPVPDSKTGAKMYLLHIEMMNVDALRNANGQK